MVFWTRTMTGWDPWLEFRRIEREWPQFSVQTDEQGLRLRGLVPGFAIENLEVSVSGDVLTVSGKRESLGEFERSWKLPFPVDAEKIKALAKDGVLDVELPRATADAPRKIQVQAG